MKPHQHFVCQGKCVIAEPDYRAALLECAHTLATDTLRKVIIPGAQQNPPVTTSDVLELIDYDLHGFFICIEWRRHESSIVACDGFKAALLKRLANHLLTSVGSSEDNATLAIVEMLLFLARFSEDGETMRSVLRRVKSHRITLPVCLSAALMQLCIDTYFDDGVDALIEFGITPTRGLLLDGSDMPLSRVIQMLSSNDFHQIDVPLNPWACRATNILKSLVASGVDLMTPLQRASGDSIALHRVAKVAVNSSEAARIIIEHTPVDGLNVRAAMMSHRQTTFTPLAMAICNAVNLSRTNPFGASRALRHAVFPLLTAGASMEPDLLEMTDARFVQLIAAVAMAEGDYNPDMEVRRMVAFTVEARHKSGLNVTKMMEAVGDTSRLPQNQADAVKRVANSIRSAYPRSLQAICRSTILRHLPIGVPRRNNAIYDGLSDILPPLIRNYLRFSDLHGLCVIT